jgi:hypothetical protein
MMRTKVSTILIVMMIAVIVMTVEVMMTMVIMMMRTSVSNSCNTILFLLLLYNYVSNSFCSS